MLPERMFEDMVGNRLPWIETDDALVQADTLISRVLANLNRCLPARMLNFDRQNLRQHFEHGRNGSIRRSDRG